MRILITVLIVQFLYCNGIHRGCMVDGNSRVYDSRPELTETYLSPSGHFMIHYNAPNSNDAPIQEDINPINGIPDYVEQVGAIADSTRQILTEVMSFRPEINDSDGKYDIYIVDLGSSFNAAYGWNYLDNNDDIEGTSWVEIDNDYSENLYYTNGLKAMRVTVAHEFFHAIQRAYHEKSSGTYIEGGGNSVNYGYFYEFTSMWIEDVIVPEGNDYLHFLSSSGDSRRFFSNPEQKFSDTDGYSVALFGHYLSSIVEGISDETLNTIIREVWEKFSDDLMDPINAFDSVLDDYDSNFIQSWIDFCSRNFHNGQFPDINNDIYYHMDQTSTVLDGLDIDNANLHQGYVALDQSLDTLSLLDDELFEFELDNRSIEMHTIIVDSMALLSMTYSNFPEVGKYIVTELSSPDIDNTKIENISSNPVLLNTNNIIHFIYAENSSNIVDIDVTPSVAYFPSTPGIISALAVQNGVELLWSSLSEEGNLSYNVYRDGLLIVSELLEDSYIDINVDPVTEYEYRISCSNAVGESELSNSISVVTWPNNSDITSTKIISLYPNPIYRPGISNFSVLIDYGIDISNVNIAMYDIQGRELLYKNIGDRDKGRFREELGEFLSKDFSSGIYFIYFNCDGVTLKQKFVIL